MKKVSIIIPVYNVQKYLPQCLDSIMCQGYVNWEAILIDDGSTDLSGEICDEYSQKDERFIVIHKKNGGAASAKNAGLDHASGCYITFVDSDDFVDHDWLKTVLAVAQESAADVVEYDFDKVYQHDRVRVNYFPERTNFSAESYLAQYVQTWTSSLFWNKLFRAELVRNIRFKQERRCIDDEFFTYKALSKSRKIVRISNVLYHYRQRASSAVYNPKNQHQVAIDSLDVLMERYEWISTCFPRLRKVYLQHDIQILFYFASFSHTNETIEQFQKIRKFYFTESILHPVGLSAIYMAVKLQFLPKDLLLTEQTFTKENRDIGDYFE